MFEMAIWN